jgi:hypothetical protein
LWVGWTKAPSVILSVAKDLKKVVRDVVDMEWQVRLLRVQHTGKGGI